ncbi:MAG: hypothetical protein HZA61_04790, partial [Candidatus Eisenbacteria bacterium]|nr:hypothetical protein [Candidatus Eisenbacteria bacterium]
MTAAPALVLAAWLAAFGSAPPAANAPELAPYRALARNRADAEGVLAAARLGLGMALGRAVAPPLLRVPEWPG